MWSLTLWLLVSVAKSPKPLSELAANLVNRHVSVIVTNAAGTALRAKAVTATVPIVFVASPVGVGQPRTG